MIFESVDDKLKALGFIKGDDSVFGFTFVRAYGKFGGIQKVIFENNTLISYDSTIPDYKGQGFKAVGLKDDELILFYKKIKQWRKKHEHNK